MWTERIEIQTSTHGAEFVQRVDLEMMYDLALVIQLVATPQIGRACEDRCCVCLVRSGALGLTVVSTTNIDAAHHEREFPH